MNPDPADDICECDDKVPETITLEIELDGKVASDLLVFAHMQGMDIKQYCEYILEEKWVSVLDVMQVEH